MLPTFQSHWLWQSKTLLPNQYHLLYEKRTWGSPTNLRLQVDRQQMPLNHQEQLRVVEYWLAASIISPLAWILTTMGFKFFCLRISFRFNLVWDLPGALCLGGDWQTVPPVSRNLSEREVHCSLPSALGLARLWLIRTTLLFTCLTRVYAQCVPGEWDFNKDQALLLNPPCQWNPASWIRRSAGSKHRCFMLPCLPPPNPSTC